MENRRALITGILGQDGSFLAELLSKKGYQVFGIVKGSSTIERAEWLKSLIPDVTLYTRDKLGKSFLEYTIDTVRPHEIYNLAGYSNVLNPWDDLDEIFNLNAKLPQDILECIVKVDKSIKFIQASSCLVFGKDDSGFQNEKTPSSPIHPYGVSKLYADNIIKAFRETFGLFACSAIFFSHESERRPDIFLSRKITSTVARIKNGSEEKIKIGNTLSFRDYGYAPDFMEAMYLMAQNKTPENYVIGTGRVIAISDFVKKCFDYVGMESEKYIEVDDNLKRKNDTNVLRADITKIKHELGWYPKHSIDDIISKMIDHDLKTQ